MRHLFLLVLLCGLGQVGLQAQEVRLNGYAHYVFDDKFDTYYSNTSYFRGKIKGGFQWGFGFEYKPNPYYGMELLYLHQDTEAPVYYYLQGDRDRVMDIGVNYILLSGSRYFASNGPLEAYGGFMAGAVIFQNKAPQVGEPGSVTKLALGIKLGANFWATDRIGLKVQTTFLSAIQAFGGSFYFGTGGSGAGVSTYSTITQFELGGGLAIRLAR